MGSLADHLMDHEEERRGSEDWATTEQTVVHNLMKNCDGEAVNSLTVAELRRAIGVLEVNSYEVNDGLRGCFPIGSLLSHNCIPNSAHIWTQTAPYTNTCIAAVDLEAGQEVSETVVKQIVENIIDATKDIIDKQRNNVDKWLELEKSSLKLVHPQHEVMLEITKWLVPVLCRGPNQVTAEFPINLVRRKLKLAQSYLSVLDVVEPGFSKLRAKVLYEIIETDLFLMFHDQPGSDQIKANLAGHVNQLNMVILVLGRLCPNRGFESILMQASKNILVKIGGIVSQLKADCLNLEDWRDGWSLVELWRGGE